MRRGSRSRRGSDQLKKRLADRKVKVYQDWREMLDKEGKNLDIGQRRHARPHARPDGDGGDAAGPARLRAEAAGPRHLYEARRLTEFAREKKLVTQMGIQIHSAPITASASRSSRAGPSARSRKSHLWSDRKNGATRRRCPSRSDPVPEGLNWDQWLGVCAARPYLAGYYHPGNWRKRLDFGTGTFGDMGCHIFDPVFKALALTAPLSVRSEGPAANQWNWSLDAIIHYVFPGTQYTAGPTVQVHLVRRRRAAAAGRAGAVGRRRRARSKGSIFIGTKGVMVLPHIALPVLLPKAKFADYQLPRDTGTTHNKQFIDAVLGNGTTTSARSTTPAR